MIVLSEFATIVAVLKLCVLMCFNNTFLFLLETLYIILDVNPLFKIYIEILTNPLDLSNILVEHKLNNIIYLSVIIMFQTFALLILIIHKIIIIGKLIEFIKTIENYNKLQMLIFGICNILKIMIFMISIVEYMYNFKFAVISYIYSSYKYEITTTINEIIMLPTYDDNSIYIDQINKYLKVDKTFNIKNIYYNNIYNIEYNGLYNINKITNYTSKYKNILNKIFIKDITDEILRYLFVYK